MAAIQIPIEDTIMETASRIFERRGTTIAEAVRSYIQQTVDSESKKMSLADGRRAFYELREQARKNGLQGMSLDDINREITLTRMGL